MNRLISNSLKALCLSLCCLYAATSLAEKAQKISSVTDSCTEAISSEKVIMLDALSSVFALTGTNKNLLVRVIPMYPMHAALQRIEGWVKIEFIITATGAVRAPKVVASEPIHMFDTSAIKAILQWKFKPKIIGGCTVEQRAIQTLEFKLNK